MFYLSRGQKVARYLNFASIGYLSTLLKETEVLQDHFVMSVCVCTMLKHTMAFVAQIKNVLYLHYATTKAKI